MGNGSSPRVLSTNDVHLACGLIRADRTWNVNSWRRGRHLPGPQDACRSLSRWRLERGDAGAASGTLVLSNGPTAWFAAVGFPAASSAGSAPRPSTTAHELAAPSPRGTARAMPSDDAPPPSPARPDTAAPSRAPPARPCASCSIPPAARSGLAGISPKTRRPFPEARLARLPPEPACWHRTGRPPRGLPRGAGSRAAGPQDGALAAGRNPPRCLRATFATAPCRRVQAAVRARLALTAAPSRSPRRNRDSPLRHRVYRRGVMAGRSPTRALVGTFSPGASPSRPPSPRVGFGWW